MCLNNEKSINLIFIDKSFFKNFKICNNYKQKIITSVINPQELETLSLQLTKYINLTTLNLDLFNNQIGDKGLQCFSEKMCQLFSLTSLSLNLSRNSITEKGCGYLVNGLNDLKNLTYLNLNMNFNKLDNQCMNKFSVLEIPSLQFLDLSLSINNIESEGVTNFSQAISNQKNLKNIRLDFSHNHFANSAFISLVNSIKHLDWISSIDLNFSCNNLLGDKDVSILSEGLGSIFRLNHLKLNLSFTNISSLAAEYISKCLYRLVNLNSFHLYGFNKKNNSRCIDILYNSLLPLRKLNSITLNVNLVEISEDLADKIRKLTKKTFTM